MHRLKFDIFLMTFVLFSNICSAQDTISLWPSYKDDYRKSAVRFFHYSADSGNYRKTAIIFCPGGSYCYLSKTDEGHNPARLFASRGFQTFVLYYRRGIKGNRYPSQIQDLQTAIAYVRRHADEYGIDRIGTCGFSAGGHLSGTAAEYYDHHFISDTTSVAPDFSIMMYPVVTMSEPYVHHKSYRNLLGDIEGKKKQALSLELNTRPSMPPLYIVACKDDPIVDYHNSVILADSLENTGCRYRFHLFEQGGHGFGVDPNLIKSSDKRAALWYNDCIRWTEELRNKGINELMNK